MGIQKWRGLGLGWLEGGVGMGQESVLPKPWLFSPQTQHLQLEQCFTKFNCVRSITST